MFQGWNVAGRLRLTQGLRALTIVGLIWTGILGSSAGRAAEPFLYGNSAPAGTQLPPQLAEQWHPSRLQHTAYANEEPGTATVISDPGVGPAGYRGEECPTWIGAPHMIGDFFGNSAVMQSILPGQLNGQAIFLTPGGAGNINYYRQVDPTGLPGTFVTTDNVFVPDVNFPPGTPTLLQEYDDGGVFVGDPATLGALVDPGPFVAVPDGIAPMVNLVAPEAGGPLVNQQLFDMRRAVFVGIPSPGEVIGRLKIGNNGSPLPHDRVFLNYSDFQDVPLFPGGVNVRRIVPGAERTFFDGRMSLQIRVPIALTLDTDIEADGITDTSKSELGDVAVTLKHLLHRSETYALSAGLTVTAPTAQDVRIVLSDGTELLEVENEAVHIMPFIGGLYTPNERCFAQWFLQGDFDASGNPVRTNNFIAGFADAGTFHDAAYLYFDMSLGFWVYRNPPEIRRTFSDGVQHFHIQSKGPLHLTGVAPMVEFHYNRTLGGTDSLSTPWLQVGREQGSLEFWNFVLGGTLEFGPSLSVTAAYVEPMGPDQQFDRAAQVFINWFPGPQ